VPYEINLRSFTFDFLAKRGGHGTVIRVILVNRVFFSSFPRSSRVKPYLGTLNTYPVGRIIVLIVFVVIFRGVGRICGVN
jgi:hypothetical protein